MNSNKIPAESPDFFFVVRNYVDSPLYSGEFENPNCRIHNYNTTEIRQCFNQYDEIIMFGDSRTRVLYRVLKGRYDGISQVVDYKMHKKLVEPPFTFYWSINFNQTVKTLSGYKNKLDGKSRLVIVGEQLQWPQLDHLKKIANCSQSTSRKNLKTHLRYAKSLIQKLEEYKNFEFLFVSAESRYDTMAGQKCACCAKWSAEDWDSLSKYYTENIRGFFEKFKPKNAMFMETNRITMEYEFDEGKTRQHLMPDGVHKMNRGPHSKPTEFAPSLKIDSEVVFNYFCNKKFNFEDTCCN